MIGQYPLIPNQAFLYLPPQDEVIVTRNGKRQRNIFGGNLSFQKFQEQQMTQFMTFLSNLKNVSPYIKNCHKPVLLRHLQATQFNFEHCYQTLQKLQKWEEGMLPLRITSQIQRILKAGVIYHCGRDCHYRPIFVINVGKILQMRLKQKQIMSSLGYFFEYVIENLLVEGQIQNWNSIIDLGNASAFSLGRTLIDTIAFLSSMFRCRVNHSFIVNCPSSIKWVWEIIKNSLNEDQLTKISMTDQTHLQNHAWKFINTSQVQKKYGGTLENILNFWPITIDNSTTIVVRNSQEIGKYMSITQYNQLFKQNRLIDKKIKQGLIMKFCNQNLTKKEYFKKQDYQLNHLLPGLSEDRKGTLMRAIGPTVCQDIRVQQQIPQFKARFYLPLCFSD